MPENTLSLDLNATRYDGFITNDVPEIRKSKIALIIIFI